MSAEERLRRLEDIEAVRLLMARYHQACDGWGSDGTHRLPDAIADLFTDDGVWGIPKPEGATTDVPAVGRAEIMALAEELQAVHWIVHFVVNPVVEVDGDEATAEFKGIVRMRGTPSAPAGWALGIYRADAVRAAEEWRFRSLSWETLSVSHEPPPGVRGGRAR